MKFLTLYRFSSYSTEQKSYAVFISDNPTVRISLDECDVVILLRLYILDRNRLENLTRRWFGFFAKNSITSQRNEDATRVDFTTDLSEESILEFCNQSYREIVHNFTE